MDDVWRRNLFLTFPAERCFIIPWNSRSREPLDTDIINQVKLLFCEVEGGQACRRCYTFSLNCFCIVLTIGSLSTKTIPRQRINIWELKCVPFGTRLDLTWSGSGEASRWNLGRRKLWEVGHLRGGVGHPGGHECHRPSLHGAGRVKLVQGVVTALTVGELTTGDILYYEECDQYFGQPQQLEVGGNVLVTGVSMRGGHLSISGVGDGQEGAFLVIIITNSGRSGGPAPWQDFFKKGLGGVRGSDSTPHPSVTGVGRRSGWGGSLEWLIVIAPLPNFGVRGSKPL